MEGIREMKNAIHSFLLLLGIALLPFCAHANKIPLQVKGQSFFKNLKLNNSLKILESNDSENLSELSYFLLEDALYILDSEIKATGYLYPSFKIEWNGRSELYPAPITWNFLEGFNVDISHAFPITKAKIIVIPDVLFYYQTLHIEGVPETMGNMKDKLYDTSNTIISKSTRFYSPSRWNNGLAAIINNLETAGYGRARIIETEVNENTNTGEVIAHVVFEKGPLCYVSSFQAEIEDLKITFDNTAANEFTGQLFTQDKLRSLIQTYRKKLVQLGYPEATFNSSITEHPVSPDRLELEIDLKIITGPKVTINSIRFEGGETFKKSTLFRQIDIRPGELLNTDDLRLGQRKLNAMGLFDKVTVTYDKLDPHAWDVVYALEPRPRNRFNLIFGIGSYDGLRVGTLWQHVNLFNRGQKGRMKLIVSSKTSQLNYVHSMPQFLGEKWQVYSDFEFLDREEVSFDRIEYTATVGTRTVFAKPNIRFTSQFNYELIRDEEVGFLKSTGPTHTKVSSLEFRATKNETNNLLSPTQGYSISAKVEMASPNLGGDVQYFQIEIPAAWHIELSNVTLLHLGFKQAYVFSMNDEEFNVPINKRYFMGGENSVRGYQQGEASPLGPTGEEIGAEVYFLAQLELEQRIYSSLSALIFLDALAQTADIDHFPSDEELFSIGIGLRWNTLFGPIRIEYGHNLNPRPTDPSGTLHFSLGTAF